MKQFILITAIFGVLSVLLGAFGAHALKALLSADQLSSFKTAVQYHQIHTLAMFLTALLYLHDRSKYTKWVFYGFTLGIILFSGSIYLLSCKDLIGIQNAGWLGPITPLGGLVFITSWLILAFSAFKMRNT